MSSGVAFSEIYDGQDDIARLSRDLFGEPGKDPVASVAQFNTRATPPGTKWHYASIETEILGLVLRSATGEPVADYLHRQDLGRDRRRRPTPAWPSMALARRSPSAASTATLRDYARLGRLLAHDGAWEGRQLIPRQWVLDATTVKPADGHLAPGTATPYFGYGYQVWLLPASSADLRCSASGNQIILVDPATKLVMVHTAVRKENRRSHALMPSRLRCGSPRSASLEK